MKTMKTVMFVMVIGTLTAGVPYAFAGDGVIEINQVKALAGGVTPGDAAGFPVTITQPGSYRLTSNLDVRVTADPSNTDAIVIQGASRVTIDLNGFWIIGPTACTRGFVNQMITLSCVNRGSGRGIAETGNSSETMVMNGGIRGMGAGGAILNLGSVIQNVTATSNGGDGFFLYGSGRVLNSSATNNFGSGIYGIPPAAIENCTATGNGADGIRGTRIVNNVASENVGTGIATSTGSVVIGNSVATNNGLGLAAASPTGYGQNVFSANNGASAEVSGGIQIGTNVCNAVVCP